MSYNYYAHLKKSIAKMNPAEKASAMMEIDQASGKIPTHLRKNPELLAALGQKLIADAKEMHQSQSNKQDDRPRDSYGKYAPKKNETYSLFED